MATLPNDHVIVLCHGFLPGFREYGPNECFRDAARKLQLKGPMKYFRDVAANLQLRGNHVISPEVSRQPGPGSGIEKRAEELAQQIESKLKELQLPSNVTPKVHLIGHCMGGLDARRLVCAQEDARKRGETLAYEVQSVTTVSTPHHGSPAAACAKTVGYIGLLGLSLTPIVDLMNDSYNAMANLTPEYMAFFNRKYKNVPTVKYYSVTSTFTPQENHLFYLTHKHIKNWKCPNEEHRKAYGENDGMVSVESAQWGVPLDIIDQKTSHIGTIGWGILEIAAGDSDYAASDKLYPALVENLAMNVVPK
ncbi:Alpha/Beta hydrolase protein [Mycena pura]|uniref:GPI inositol-deacylase n=1 Tax=Mycena pura TaxID=153505 RepID=A0AAD6XYS4_9AGAR|nr:Alpha/Beta hydrolase protein [Mycena pura]